MNEIYSYLVAFAKEHGYWEEGYGEEKAAIDVLREEEVVAEGDVERYDYYYTVEETVKVDNKLITWLRPYTTGGRAPDEAGWAIEWGYLRMEDAE